MSVEEAPEKLTFEQVGDFKFTAAYEAYSKVFDSSEIAVKLQLNELITSLHDGKMDYGLFYSSINQHVQGSDRGREFRRARIEGQRKQEYQKDERKRGRNDRYRG